MKNASKIFFTFITTALNIFILLSMCIGYIFSKKSCKLWISLAFILQHVLPIYFFALSGGHMINETFFLKGHDL